MTTYKIESVSDKEQLAQITTHSIASLIKLGLSQKNRFQIALSGGTTPAETYRLLGQEELEWDRVDIFLGDERWVDIQDDASNSGMVKRTLLSKAPGR